jgi:hypothetical protein
MNFYTDVIIKDELFHITGYAIKDMNLLEPITRAGVLSIINDAAELGIALQVTETYRSTNRQAELFAKGATKLRNVGVHHFGLAADFCKIINGKASWDGDWTFLCTLAAKHGMISGGDWGFPNREHSFRDWDHVQRIAVLDQPGLLEKTWYPDDNYKPLGASNAS